MSTQDHKLIDEIIGNIQPEYREYIKSIGITGIVRILEAVSLSNELAERKIPQTIEPRTSVNDKKIEIVSNGDSNTEDIPAIAVKQGQAGELKFEMFMRTYMPFVKLICTAKHTKKADYIIEYDMNGRIYRILIDVKNHKTTIPSDEVVKFMRDLECNPSVDGAIMVCISGGKISGLRGAFNYEDTIIGHKYIPILYLSTTDDNVMLHSIKFIMSTIEAKSRCVDNKINIGIVTKLKIQLDTYALLQDNLSQLKVKLTKEIDKITKMLITTEVDMRNTVDAILRYNNVEYHVSDTETVRNDNEVVSDTGINEEVQEIVHIPTRTRRAIRARHVGKR